MASLQGGEQSRAREADAVSPMDPVGRGLRELSAQGKSVLRRNKWFSFCFRSVANLTRRNENIVSWLTSLWFY